MMRKTLFLFVLAAWMGCKQSPSPIPLPPPGMAFYEKQCASCHQSDGEGVLRTFPPLKNNATVEGPHGRLIRLALHGLEGELLSGSEVYRGACPPWGHLSDEDLADILTFIRKRWGNNAPPVPADDIKMIRLFYRDRTTPWTPEELKKPENTSVPGVAGW
ncbi:MAG TPA: cytochrome c [Rhodothermales bacterium]|nr:cytochrome c [Rhodothermales bacterium]